METIAQTPAPEKVTINNLCEITSIDIEDDKKIVMCRIDPEKYIKDLANANFLWIEKAKNQILKIGIYVFSGFYRDNNKSPIYRAEEPVYKTVS